MGFGGEYRIDLYRDDDTLSVVMVVHARADIDAKVDAERMLKDGLVRAEIWRDDVRIGVLDHRTARPSAAPNEFLPHLWRIEF